MPDGGWDLVAVAPSTHQVFVARTANVTAVDLAHAGKARTLGQIERGHAALPIPNSSRLLVTSGKDNSVYILDQRTGRQIARLAVGANPDAAIIDPTSRHAFVMNAKDGTVSVIDLATIRVYATVQLKPGLELPAITPEGMLFINNEEANEIESIDLQTLRPGAAIPLPGCEGPTGLAFDPGSAKLISACANRRCAFRPGNGTSRHRARSRRRDPRPVAPDRVYPVRPRRNT
ncbi:YncE family protein [Sphingomonas sp. ID1715]|uniref:YncE family protein n=1 Tax=Sphingomonas sp. ID1715 TaxID=1656898 RepID=UPI0020C54E40|nr:hypothetical protein [Sphingomonas sp. ID1715]